MSISFSGLASGLDTSSWVEALVSVKQSKVTTQQKELSTLQSTKTVLNDTRSTISSLRTAIEKITDAKFGGTFDLFSSNTATSSNSDVFTATANSSAVRQNYDITVQQLATFTKATSLSAASAIADDDTNLRNMGVTKGTITAYVNGQKHSVNIEETDTLGDLKARMAGYGISTSIDENGAIHFSAENEGDAIHIGATTDSSNFVSLFGLERQEDGSYASGSSLYKASVSSKLTSEEAGFNEQIKSGTFTIGNATFTINENTTLSSLISDINNTEDAQAYAYWDDATGKLSITSTKEGASYINIEAGTSNFTDVMGLTNSTWDEDGNLLASRMLTGAQELGQNAQLTINGTSITSSSNTVSSDISRIAGVTINLHRANTEEDGKTTLKVDQNTAPLKDAINEFISAYNNAVSKIDDVTATGGTFQRDTSLTSLKRTIRTYANSSSSNDGVYKLLSDIGISTSKANSADLGVDTEKLTLDEGKLMDALANNPGAVESLLTGENGILNMMEDAVEQSLQATSGYFDVKTSTLDSDIKKMQTKITNQNKSIETYRKQLEAKFQKMEQMVSSMQQNYSSFLS